jgi:hypothetical protein
MNERVQETAQLEALLMGAPPGTVSTVHHHYVRLKLAETIFYIFILHV